MAGMLPDSAIIVLIGSSLVLSLVGLPMALGKVRPNPVYGVRLPVTMRSPAAWRVANVHYGWWLFWTGLATLPVALCLWWLRPGVAGVFVYLGLMMMPLLIGLAPTMSLAYRAERAERSAEGGSDVRSEAETAIDQADDERSGIPPQFRS